MEHLDFSSEAISHEALLALDYDHHHHHHRYPFVPASTWPLLDQTMSHPTSNDAVVDHRPSTTSSARPMTSTTASAATTSAPPLAAAGLDYTHMLDPSATYYPREWLCPPLSQPSSQHYLHDAGLDSYAAYGAPLQTSPVDFMPASAASVSASLAMDANSYMAFSAPVDNMSAGMAFHMADFQQDLFHAATDFAAPTLHSASPTDTLLEIRSLSSSDNGYTMVDFPPSSRRSFESFTDTSSNAVVDPSHTVALHIRTDSGTSASDAAVSVRSFGSWEEITYPPLQSPQSEIALDLNHPQAIPHGLPHHRHSIEQRFPSPTQASISPSSVVEPVPIVIKKAVAPSTSPTSIGISSPPSRRRKSPSAKVTKSIIRKPSPNSAKTENVVEKRVGRRKGPLRPDQRQQAHEIRKLRACLRCKFLKKTCDKGDPCGGCKPSHARLWQVPCTRIDIKDIAYFMKDWKADFERHVTLGFSVGNIKGFSPTERPLFITHGFGSYFPITAREVYVREDNCFEVDWVESIHETPREFEVKTARLSAGAEGVSRSVLSAYLDHHLDGGFESFVDDLFEGTKFITEILKTAYRYYLRERLPVIRKALKYVLAYNMTMHITLVEGLSEDEARTGFIDDEGSKYYGKTVAPVMINFQVKCALAEIWRELQKEILEDLSALYSSVYSGDKLKNWPTIFMLAALLLIVWEEMQFDSYYRVPERATVEKFCTDMETTPVGVIVGLFSAISQKLPAFNEWDTRKHHHLLGSNPAVCDAMTDVRSHVTRYGRFSFSFPSHDG